MRKKAYKPATSKDMQKIWLTIWRSVEANDQAALNSVLAEHRDIFKKDINSADRVGTIIEQAHRCKVMPIKARIEAIEKNLTRKKIVKVKAA